MLTAVVTGPSIEGAEGADLLEFRAIDQIQELREKAVVPVIFKVEEEKDLDQLLSLNPDYVDLDHEMPQKVFEEVGKKAKVICSYHNFEETPDDLEGILKKIQRRPASLYKIATFAQSSLDSMRLLKLLKEHENLIGVCMGECGQCTRILAPVFGSAWTYAAIDQEHTSAPGQLDLHTLKEVYHYDRLGPNTKVLALIGGKVSHSPSNSTHNEVMRRLGINGVFVRIKVKEEEVEKFLKLANELGFYGFSVTMPLKEKVLPPRVINTLLMPDKGTNTDGRGTLDAIEKRLPVKGKRVVVLGAGGAGKAIAEEAKKRGAEVVMLNRTPGRGGALGFDQFPRIAKEGYDVLVNATSASMFGESLSITKYFFPDKVMMDVVYEPMETEFLKSTPCIPIYGREMFIRQAVYQFKFWFGDLAESLDPDQFYDVANLG